MRNAFTMFAECAEYKLGRSVTLLGGALQPLRRPGMVLRDTIPLVKFTAKRILRFRVILVGRGH